jgi:hypothetical protein
MFVITAVIVMSGRALTGELALQGKGRTLSTWGSAGATNMQKGFYGFCLRKQPLRAFWYQMSVGFNNISFII